MPKLTRFLFALFLPMTAYAGPGDPHPVCFNVHCVYKRQDGSSCQAAARFIKLVSEEGAELADVSNAKDDPEFEVECDEHMLFNGTAHRYTDRQGTRIQASIGPYPAVLLRPGALRDGHRYELSALELGREQLRGFCYVYTGPEPQPGLY